MFRNIQAFSSKLDLFDPYCPVRGLSRFEILGVPLSVLSITKLPHINTDESQNPHSILLLPLHNQDAVRHIDLQSEGRKPHLPRLPKRLQTTPRRRLSNPSYIECASEITHPHLRKHDLQPCQTRKHLLGGDYKEQCQCCAGV